LARGRDFNAGSVGDFFEYLVNVIDENNTDALQVFNLDDSGFFTVQRRVGKTLGKKWMSHIDIFSNGNREVSITLAYYVIASGTLCFP
jgi:hypothetical protein